MELIERDDDFGDGWYLGRHLMNGGSGLFPEGDNLSHTLHQVSKADLPQSTPVLHPEDLLLTPP